jgi:hypothetical protein
MRSAFSLTLFLCCMGTGMAQTQSPPKAPAASQPRQPAKARPEQHIENIRHEDAGSRIDELREGGETKRITVKPKGDMPAYELGNQTGNRNPASTDTEGGKGGSPGWKLREF